MNVVRLTQVAQRVVPRAYMSTSPRPFRVLGVQQIAIGSVERGPLKQLWQDIFGLQPSSTMKLEKENVEEDILKLGPSPYEVEVDLMTPVDPNGKPKVASHLVLFFSVFVTSCL